MCGYMNTEDQKFIAPAKGGQFWEVLAGRHNLKELFDGSVGSSVDLCWDSGSIMIGDKRFVISFGYGVRNVLIQWKTSQG